ncbi:MAG TPA: aminotransferase class I and II [Solibacterales bacterium]|nr:aminotransferase class I and II [Bryobacterales bacterium]
MRTVCATRYVTPLREGGSLPAIVEADDLGLYVLKFRGAGQGKAALAAEVMAGLIAVELGLPVPELVLVEVDPALGRNEADPEIRDLLRASAGLNMGLDYLPGSVMFDRAAGDRVDARLASEIVWFDAYVTNVDRTARNPNLLWWHRKLHLIDHGAALYFQHDWTSGERLRRSPFAAVKDHVLLPWASELGAAQERLSPRLGRSSLEAIVGATPAEWLAGPAGGYVDFLAGRLAASDLFVKEAEDARARLV